MILLIIIIPWDLVVKWQGMNNAVVTFLASLAMDHRPHVMSTQNIVV